MSDINLVKLGWEESVSWREKGHLQRPWGGSPQRHFVRNCEVSELRTRVLKEVGQSAGALCGP